jgi:hypothetical protein
MTNTGQNFSQPGVWHISSNALQMRVELSLIGPSNSTGVIQWKPTLQEVTFETNGAGQLFGVAGQPWISVSQPFPLTGATQTFVSGVFGESGFYRIKLGP